MIYFLYGEESDKAREKAHELMDALLKKRPDASLFHLDAESWTAEEMERLIGGSGLFQSNYIVFLNGVLENSEAEDLVLSRLKELEESPNVFIMLEGIVKKLVKDKIEKRASKSQEFSSEDIPVRAEFGNFALADALGRRDKKELWVLLQKAVTEGKAPEEFHGMLFWQTKCMLQAANAKSPADSGLKPFVYSKSLRYSKNYSLDELGEKSAELVSIYHEARRGGDDLDIALEKFVLDL
jgi:DNA polymerase III delta subunit